MTAATPEWIGRYRVREVLGTGAFATVYRGTDEHLDVDVAIKVLAENHSLDPDVRKRFIDEGRRLRRLHSPHVVPVHDLGDTERAQPYLVLEWADRGDLAKRVAERRDQGSSPTLDDVLTVARALAAALSVLHRNHLVHRDLAPSNLLLCPSSPSPSPEPGQVVAPGPSAPAAPAPDTGPLVAADERLVLADLGLSKDLAAASGLTAAAGTSGFAPPEQRDPGGTVDQRSDVWAASALLVWLVLGQPPGDVSDWRRRLRSAGRPAAVTRTLDRGLAQRPDKRPPTIHDWLAGLEGAVTPPGSAGPEPNPPTPDPAGPAATARARLGRNRMWAGAVVAALLAGVAIGAVAAGRDSAGSAATIEQLEGGDQRTVVDEHGVTIELVGPTETAVGEPVQLTADVTGTETWQWVGPDGAVYPNQAVIDLAPETSGRGTARLLAFDKEGRVVEAAHALQVSGDERS